MKAFQWVGSLFKLSVYLLQSEAIIFNLGVDVIVLGFSIVVWVLGTACPERIISCWLQVAAFEGHAKVLKLLLQHKDVDVQDRAPHTGWVPMHEAALRGHVAIIKLLLQMGAPLNPRTPDNDTPRDLALRFNQRAVLEVLG